MYGLALHLVLRGKEDLSYLFRVSHTNYWLMQQQKCDAAMQYTAQICRNKEQQLCNALLPCAAVHFCMACRRPSFKERPAWTWSCWSIHMNTTTINQTCRPRFICPKYLWGRVVNALIKGVLQTCAQKQALSNSCLSSVGNKSVWASCYVQTAQPQHIFLDDYD